MCGCCNETFVPNHTVYWCHFIKIHCLFTGFLLLYSMIFNQITDQNSIRHCRTRLLNSDASHTTSHTSRRQSKFWWHLAKLEEHPWLLCEGCIVENTIQTQTRGNVSRSWWSCSRSHFRTCLKNLENSCPKIHPLYCELKSKVGNSKYSACYLSLVIK